MLYSDGRLRGETVLEIGERLNADYDFSLDVLIRSFQDMLRRGAIQLESANALARDVEDNPRFGKLVDLFAAEAISRLQSTGPSRPHFVPDFPSLLRRELQRHRFEKSRRRRRWF